MQPKVKRNKTTFLPRFSQNLPARPSQRQEPESSTKSGTHFEDEVWQRFFSQNEF